MSSDSLRKIQMEREKLLNDIDFNLFSESLAKKNPLNGHNSTTSSSLWEKELGPFYNETMKNIPGHIKKNLDVKFKHIGSGIADERHKEKFKKLMLRFMHSNCKYLVFITTKITLDICLNKSKDSSDVSYQYVVGRIAKEIFRKTKKMLVDSKILSGQTISEIMPVDEKLSPIENNLKRIAGYFFE
ncbi:hypothetical protein [Solidesulfovibrio magneticus]|uniref:Uncharacterized protein n=1 Tax=Solidesulfovibrio magneticus (strain ATCC 700980 / DSM 13731 / RS-1) TaxID=573370 RepID=C4XIF6_SOLM1|nr:hypothetical protein [Solidesulfovibrio magneticus]BAH76531.1 hypothetical protein DMR_30400 [Solidesulfovibrio magneticus RS-1]